MSGEWQPIETAPTNETVIICYGKVAGEFYGVYDKDMIFPAYFWGKSDYSGFEWMIPETDYAAMWMKPTHWMPLPNPPAPSPPSGA